MLKEIKYPHHKSLLFTCAYDDTKHMVAYTTAATGVLKGKTFRILGRGINFFGSNDNKAGRIPWMNVPWLLNLTLRSQRCPIRIRNIF